ncbi:uncharacterized protein LOC125572213 [Nematostella vectensis]|uniref:uncharacterized protein LOC125572213 n=1 Tax=Nematostella vectensis TaxID=45351 RepID=UPI002076E57E|nr:uncharacterized protein LOC125572213 [Nematostella vectensis]
MHTVNFDGVQKLCETCKGWSMDRLECETCGLRKRSFTTVQAFCDWLFDGSNAGYTFLAHNFKGYDSYFILEYLFTNGFKPEVIFTGEKVMYLNIKSLRIDMKCTLNFLQMPLSKLPKAFGFDHVTQKGTFPHFFNTPEHQDYVGPMPDLSYYDLQGMKEDDARALRAWHQASVARGAVFYLQEDLASYFHLDVEVFKRAVLAFDELIMAAAGLHPFQWLKYIEHREGEGVFIQHAGNRGEVRLAGRIKVDGYAESTNTVYQYHGCFYHGCTTCFQPHTVNPLTNTTMQELRKHTFAVELRLKAHGYNYEEVWEWRTNAIRLHCEANEEQGEEIHYYDFTSLYPWVNAICEYPVRHPDAILTENFEEDLHAYKGLMKLRVLPPRDLFFPVLPVRVNDKLMFPLCHRCAQEKEQGSCTHLDEERAFTGTWAHPEIYKALEKDYRVIRVCEVWHWERWARLFEEYIKTFLKYKQEASGWPAWCTTDADKMQYVDYYERHQGVRMDPSKIEKNPGLRSVERWA